MLPTRQIPVITTNAPLRKSACAAAFKRLPGFHSAEIIAASEPAITVRHHPVCGYGLHRQRLGEGAGCFPGWREGGRGLRLSSASPALVTDAPFCRGPWQSPAEPGAGSPGAGVSWGSAAPSSPIILTATCHLFQIALQHFKEQHCG